MQKNIATVTFIEWQPEKTKLRSFLMRIYHVIYTFVCMYVSIYVCIPMYLCT
jgi:hypothetical protein